MDTSKYLIFINSKNRTSDVNTCEYNVNIHKYDITFSPDGIVYSYNRSSVVYMTNPEELLPNLVSITRNNTRLKNIKAIKLFRSEDKTYWHITNLKGNETIFSAEELEIEYSCLDDNDAAACLQYLKDAASLNKLEGPDGTQLLKKQYEKIDFVDKNAAMSVYLNPKIFKANVYPKQDIIYPFGGNASQFKAVSVAMTNQLSVIQGPPGTGKTQTILNIIANILIRNKSVQIVSNNNSAILNILEKLSAPKYNLDFLVALLGNSENKKSFCENQKESYPDLSSWEVDTAKQNQISADITSLSKELTKAFANQERLAKAKSEYDALELEYKHFKKYTEDEKLNIVDVKLRKTLNSDKLMQFWMESTKFAEKNINFSLWFKIKSMFVYGIYDWNFYKNDIILIITMIQDLFYKIKKKELLLEIDKLNKYLIDNKTNVKMEELTKLSTDYLRAKLFFCYGNKERRKKFNNLKDNSYEVLKEYPIILSTTFSSSSSLENVTYDYLIMDEASQVDIATGALALAGTINAVIVGDLKQLPNVVKDDEIKEHKRIFPSNRLHPGYSFADNSFLKSICSVIPEIPQTLLREHYRCHPKIIGFCNHKFYKDELIIMTKNNDESDAMSVFRTNVGNHKREHYNQRQIDVSLEEALPMLKNSAKSEIGIIAPYNDQVLKIRRQCLNEIEVGTVHKFQGREKEIILLTTVDDVATDFSDNPYLLNVAISRAKSKFCLIASGNEQPKDSNINELIDYINYNNLTYINSKLYSVFDMLYKQYTKDLLSFLQKHEKISEYNSENLMYGIIKDIIMERPNLNLDVLVHYQLSQLIRDTKTLDENELVYAKNPGTHLDFLIYNTVTNKPILAIEVDGVAYHRPGTLQYRRDRMKDSILNKHNLSLIRFSTDGYGEKDKIADFIDNKFNMVG